MEYRLIIVVLIAALIGGIFNWLNSKHKIWIYSKKSIREIKSADERLWQQREDEKARQFKLQQSQVLQQAKAIVKAQGKQ